jgi:hypothetical protein
MNNGRASLGGAGTQTAAVGFGGNPGTGVNTELYNGSAWTTSGNMNTSRTYRWNRNSNSSIRNWWIYHWYSAACEESFNGSTWTTKEV